MPTLIVHLPDGGIARHELTAGAYTLGRAEGNDIVLPAGAASGHHAVLKLSDTGDYTITDLGSTNHTRVNGRVVQIQPLRNGDQLLFGDVAATYESEIPASLAFEDQPTQIYEPVPPAPAVAAAAQVPVRPVPAHAVFRPGAPVPRRRTRRGNDDAGCFALLMVLLLPLAFAVGMVVRYYQMSGGKWLWDYVREVLAAS